MGGVLVVSNGGIVYNYPEGKISCGICGQDVSESAFAPHIDVYDGKGSVLRVKDTCHECAKPFYNSKITFPEAVERARKSKNLEEIKVKIEPCDDKKLLEEHAPYELFVYKNGDNQILHCVCGGRPSAFDDG